MPIYDYACAACGHRFEVVHGVHGHGPEHCPNCGGGPVRKAFAPPTIMFKGSGWAKMDRRSNSGSGASARKGGDEASGGSAKEAGDGAAAASKTEASDGKASKGSTGDGGASGSSSGSSATTAAD